MMNKKNKQTNQDANKKGFKNKLKPSNEEVYFNILWEFSFLEGERHEISRREIFTSSRKEENQLPQGRKNL